MSRVLNPRLVWLAAAVAVLAVGLGCSTDSPTAPQQTPAPPPGTDVSATWAITISVSERQLIVDSDDSATVTVQVRRVGDNQPPINGSTIVLSTTLGEFDAPGSGLKSLVLSTFNGRAEIQLFPGEVLGSALLTAQLEASAGQTAIDIVRAIEPLVAAFDFANSNTNLSVQFQNLSTGNPEKFRWDFGDGGTSREENPSHLYDQEGDYVVKLTVSKRGTPDASVSRVVSVTEDPDDVVVASFEFTVEGQRVIFQDTSTGNPTRWRWDFGDGSGSSAQNPTHEYAAAGSYVVTLTAGNRRTEDTTNVTVTVAIDVFVTGIVPNVGPAAGGTVVTISGQGFVAPLRVFFGGIQATVTSSSPSRIIATTPPGVLVTEECDDDNDMITGTRFFDTAVDVMVELQSGATDVVSGGFVYLSGAGGGCVGD